MIVYRCMNGKLKDKKVDDISFNRACTILREHNISIKALPGLVTWG